MNSEEYTALCEQMIQDTICARGLKDERILNAIRAVPRHAFVPQVDVHHVYGDYPLAIGHQQTISQPYMVAFMAYVADIPESGARVLELGTGSGYGAAVLAQLAEEVYTIEYNQALAQSATERLQECGLGSVYVRHGDGFFGWPEKQPFDAIVVTAAPPSIPQMLISQLKEDAKMVIPIGRPGEIQELQVLRRSGDGLQLERSLPVRFVPMLGQIQSIQSDSISPEYR